MAELSKQGRLFPRTSRRHVFLFEKVVVFSKLQEVASSQQDGRRVSQEGRRAQKEAYFYKAHIPVRGAGPKWWVWQKVLHASPPPAVCVCADE